MSHESVRPEIAMVSRIRVEVRGESMAACEAVAFMALEHAQLAGALEGYVPTDGEYNDHFFNRPGVTSKYGEPPEPWGELGLAYAGRLSFVFEPQSVYGGLKQPGYRVERDKDGAPSPVDTDHGFIVLNRQRPATRDHSWEGVTSMLPAEETGEAILDDIRTIRDVKNVSAVIGGDASSVTVEMDGWEDVYTSSHSFQLAAENARKRVVGMLRMANADEIIENIERLIGVAHVTVRELGATSWRVLVAFTDEDARAPVEGRGESKYDAALSAYGLCGVEVTHFDTTETSYQRAARESEEERRRTVLDDAVDRGKIAEAELRD